MENKEEGSSFKEESEDPGHFVLKIECIKEEAESDDEVSHMSPFSQNSPLHALEKHVDKVSFNAAIKTEQDDEFDG